MMKKFYLKTGELEYFVLNSLQMLDFISIDV